MYRIALMITSVLLALPVSASTLILYYSPQCPYSNRVVGYLNSIHKCVPLKNVSGNQSAREELVRIGGKAQVPCLIIDGKALYESEDIIKWFSAHKDELENMGPTGCRAQ